MTESRNGDDLLKTSPDAAIELSEQQLDNAAGGETNTLNTNTTSGDKLKSANKNADQIKGLL